MLAVLQEEEKKSHFPQNLPLLSFNVPLVDALLGIALHLSMRMRTYVTSPYKVITSFLSSSFHVTHLTETSIL